MFQVIPAKPAPRLSLLDAITALALATKIHGTDLAVQQTAFRLLGRVDPKYQPVILSIMNAPSPVEHMRAFIASLPQHIIEMKLPPERPSIFMAR